MILLARLWCGYIPLTCRQPLPLATWAFLEDIGQKVSGVSPNAFEYFLNRSNIGYFKHDGTMILIFGSLCLRDFTGSSKVSRGKANTFLCPIKKRQERQRRTWAMSLMTVSNASKTSPFAHLPLVWMVVMVSYHEASGHQDQKKSAFTISSPCIYGAHCLIFPQEFHLVTSWGFSAWPTSTSSGTSGYSSPRPMSTGCCLFLIGCTTCWRATDGTCCCKQCLNCNTGRVG